MNMNNKTKMSYTLKLTAPQSERLKLETVIRQMQVKLRTINEKLAKLKNFTKMEYNIKSRDIYLETMQNMVKEQLAIQSLLLNYKIKLRNLNSRGKMHTVTMQKPQPTKNAKLHELFNNSESQDIKEETELENATIPSPQAKKPKTEIHTQTVAKSNSTTQQIHIVNQPERRQSLRAHVKNRKFVEADSEESDVEFVEEENNYVVNDPIEDIEIEQTVVEDHPVAEQSKEDKSVEPTTISIDSPAVAVQCLKALQEYAMLNENFRAIGLLMEAEKSFLCPAESTDFEL